MMEKIFLPEYLEHTQEEWDQHLQDLFNEKTKNFLDLEQKKKKIEEELLDQMIENAKLCTDEMISLQMESNRIQELKKNCIKDLTELELTVKDCQEEIEVEKEVCKKIELQIWEKSDTLNCLNRDIDAETARINTLKESLKSKYNYYKSTVKLFSKIFNCDLQVADEDAEVYNLTLWDDTRNKEVVVQFKILENFLTTKDMELLGIKIKSAPPLDPDILNDMKELFKQSQDSQGLLAFIHKNYIE